MNSALVPLDPITQQVSELVTTLADGVQQLGTALAQTATEDPSDLV